MQIGSVLFEDLAKRIGKAHITFFESLDGDGKERLFFKMVV
jgi:hypothetical protein